MAHELEAALRRRESEPATPLSTSFKGLSYQPHTDSEPAPGGGVSEPVPGGGVSESVPGGGVSTLEEASQKLEGVSQQVCVCVCVWHPTTGVCQWDCVEGLRVELS